MSTPGFGSLGERSSTKTLVVGFMSGALAVILLQNAISIYPKVSSPSNLLFCRRLDSRDASAPPTIPEGSFPVDIGSTLSHVYPPALPTNALPSLFPTQVGFAGDKMTGAETFVVATAIAYPTGAGVPGLVNPGVSSSPSGSGTPSWVDTSGEDVLASADANKFSIFQNWANLSPAYSVPKGAFGLDSTPEVPAGCEIKGVHILHRHGARYPGGASGYASPAGLAARLHNATSTIHGNDSMAFINSWTYKLGTTVLNHFGRQQMFDLGVSMRMKYGQLLEGFTDTLPVYRTESQDRMLASSTNLAFGFFGWPLDGKFLQEVTIEAGGYNNTLAPYMTCANANVPARGDRGTPLMKQWITVYLADARARIQGQLSGYMLTVEDMFAMQTMCAYETTALGYSVFCPLFTEMEWEGFQYAWDISFWYNSGFGSPVARALGTGYVLELLSRLTHTAITPSSGPTSSEQLFAVNTTLTADPITFPLNNPIYSDATHEVVMMYIYTALNLTVLAEDGPPGVAKMKRASKRRWVTSRFAPFGSNMQVQVLMCNSPGTHLTSTGHITPSMPSTATAPTTTSTATSNEYLRVIVNDAPVSLTGISGCLSNPDGLCPLDTFVAAQERLVEGTGWDWACSGNWTVPAGDAWTTVTGDPPPKPLSEA